MVELWVAGGHALPGPTWADWVIGCSAFIILYFSMYSNIVFMMVGILDLRRRHYVASKLNEILNKTLEWTHAVIIWGQLSRCGAGQWNG